MRNRRGTSGPTRRDFFKGRFPPASAAFSFPGRPPSKEPPRRFAARRPWRADRETPAVALEADRPRAIALAPFEVLTLEARV